MRREQSLIDMAPRGRHREDILSISRNWKEEEKEETDKEGWTGRMRDAASSGSVPPIQDSPRIDKVTGADSCRGEIAEDDGEGKWKGWYKEVCNGNKAGAVTQTLESLRNYPSSAWRVTGSRYATHVSTVTIINRKRDVFVGDKRRRG